MPNGFHEVSFPLSIALETTGGPERRTDITQLSNGRENRNARWRDSRRRYDAGSGMRSRDDLMKLIAFFEARHGSLYGFRFKDPLDFSSASFGNSIASSDQIIGTGDGTMTVFQLSKTYSDVGGSAKRTIDKPISGSVVIAVDGVDVLSPDISINDAKGEVTFVTAPITNAIITAGYEFEVPVRFDIERLDFNLSAFNAGQIPSVPLVEIKP
ncbi:DUF2460 domain-containing protein [Lentilitoribacter sp. Alg239-R112]|uniref:DUF2460 domain-containing protein n=1 Tax=Lentilitoribacter sp. Alg239-R112 TaxID=2305987 RepID=UPI0013A6C429|nr:DUF2460 domain-containing protein [Lentilitoribacter sp. Alg239-R112]